MTKEILKTMIKRTSIVVLLTLGFVLSAFAQRGSTGQYRPDDIRDRYYVGAYINNPYIGGNTTGSVFSMGIQPYAGYMWNEYLSSGMTLKYDFSYIWSPGFNQNLSDFSATLFSRALIAQAFIIQAEGGFYSTEQLLTSQNTERFNFPVFYIAGGYTNKNFEVLLSYELLGELNNYQIPIDYKFGLVRYF